MTKAKRIFTSVIALAMVFCTLFAMSIPASAATCSSGTQTRTTTVTTKSNYWVPGSESITLSQSKGTCVKENYNIFTGKTTRKTSNQYGEWDIVVSATDGSHTFKKSLTGSSINHHNNCFVIACFNYMAGYFAMPKIPASMYPTVSGNQLESLLFSPHNDGRNQPVLPNTFCEVVHFFIIINIKRMIRKWIDQFHTDFYCFIFQGNSLRFFDFSVIRCTFRFIIVGKEKSLPLPLCFSN